MADGSVGIDGAQTRSAGAGGGNPFLNFFFASRTRTLITLAAIAAIALASVAGWRLYSNPATPSTTEIAWLITASTALWLPLLLLLLDSSDNMAQGPRLVLPLTTLAVLAGLATLIAVDRTENLGLLFDQLPTGRIIAKPEPIAAFLILLAAAFIPRIWNAALFANYMQREQAARREELARKQASIIPAERQRAAELDQRQREHDDAESLGAFIATVFVIAICGLAYAAGRWGHGTGLQNVVGVGISAGVIGLFLIVVFLDWIAESPPVRVASRMLRGFSRRMSWLADFYNAIDAVLVRIGAHVAGTEHREIGSRYTVLGGTMLALAVMAWYLPAPFGLIPAITGFIIALSVSRLWSWVEEDRTLASITRFNPDAPKRVGFREDFRDETLLGFLFVLVLIPIAMMQADTAHVFGQPLFEDSPGVDKGNIGVWLGYFGFELAKALPVVDWADIYDLQGGADLLKPHEAIGRHAIFAARVTVDLVLIASLLQAIGISTRNRQQKALYAARQIDRLDELVEKEELAREVARPSEEWFKHGVDFRRYNEDRLKEIHSSSKKLRLRSYIETIFHQSGRTLDPAIVVLSKMVANRASENQLYRTLEAVEREAPPLVGDLVEIMTSIRKQSGLRDFKFAVIDLAARIGNPTDIEDMAMRIMIGSLNDAQMYTRWHAAEALFRIAPRLPDRISVATDIAELEAQGPTAFGSRADLLECLLAALGKRLDELEPTARP